MLFDNAGFGEPESPGIESWVWKCSNHARLNKEEALSVLFYSGLMLIVLHLAGPEAAEGFERYCEERNAYVPVLEFLETRGHHHYMNEDWI